MSIRKTLRVAFVTVSLVSVLLISGLAFVEARQALLTEIKRSLASQATGLSAEIDKMMYERLQNAATWSHLDIMQDLQVRDVDKRLSLFLTDLQSGYHDVYLNLACVDEQNRVVSSSDASSVGSRAEISPPDYTAPMYGADVGLAFDAKGEAPVVMSVPLRMADSPGRLGTLQLQLDWARMADVLDQAASGTGRTVAVLDARGKLIAASSDLRAHAPLMGTTLAEWRALPATVQVLHGQPLTASDVIVGAAKSRGYARFAGFGWTTLVVQPVDQAFAPIHRMAWTFVVLAGAVVLYTVLTAAWVSRKIAAPIAALTAYTRGYMRNKAPGVPPVAGAGEVGELTQAFVSMVRDIAQSQQNLVRASKLAVVGEMSSIIAHEVRTPLGILRSSAQMLRREPNISSEGLELLGFIGSETERLNRLVSSMLDAARPRAATFSRVDVHALIRDAVAMLSAQAAQHGVVVSIRPEASSAVIPCDREQITQVLLNILMNGVQMLQHGGRIEVSTSDAGKFLCIELADDGPGVDPAQRARIFEAFFFQREGGIGLGLAIVQQIVLDHGGEIEAGESPLGGALFRILLPLEQAGSP